MRTFILIALLAFTWTAQAQKATIADVNKSLTDQTFKIGQEEIKYLGVPKEMIQRISAENGFGNGYDQKWISFSSQIEQIQQNDFAALRGQWFLNSQKITNANDSTYFKYPKEFQLESLAIKIAALKKEWPEFNASGYEKVYKRCAELLEQKKAVDKASLKL